MAAGDLTDLPTAKAWLGVTGTTSDAPLTTLVSAISAFVTRYLDRPILSASSVETYEGLGQDVLLLRNSPVTAVASVAFAGRTLTVAGDPVSLNGDFLFDERTVRLLHHRFPYRRPVVVSYTAGYPTPPADVAQATLELIGEAWRRRERIGLTSKSLGGQEVVAFSPSDMNATVKTMLAPYRAAAPL